MNSDRQTAGSQVVGRYAPSPTGDLHMGNLRSALLAWLHARLQGGKFIMRMEDLDTPRTVPGSADRILEDLEWLGLDWDGEVVYQSKRQALYQAALEKLRAQGLVYECFCSRKDIRQAVSAPHSKLAVYPGTCACLSIDQVQFKAQSKQAAQRVRVDDSRITFEDGCCGHQQQNLQQLVGDFVIQRADGLFAYQLAVIVDDLDQGVTDVVRGADLIDSTARQIYLSNKLQPERAAPVYWHIPLLLNNDGTRMAKRDGSDSARNWIGSGGSSQQLVGTLAAGLGLCQNRPISSQELLESLNFERLVKALKAGSHAR